MTATDPVKLARLPKWARDRITLLERDIQHWKELATVGPEDSDTFVRRWGGDDQPLGKRPYIQFRMDNGAEFEIVSDGEDLSVRSCGLMGPSISVYPQSSNVVRLAPRDRW